MDVINKSDRLVFVYSPILEADPVIRRCERAKAGSWASLQAEEVRLTLSEQLFTR